MENASLRIKFSPILKNIAFNNCKCTIEILPEVSSFQNLDKLELRMDNGLVEYSIPMTYKIYIKKENDSAVFDIEKTYHSCVDLLHAYSMSNTYLASGDVTRMISDNFILSKVTSDVERCNIILTKRDFYRSKKNHKEISKILHKTESIQTLNTEEIYGSHSTLDRSFQIDVKCESSIVVKKETIHLNNNATCNQTNEPQETEENDSNNQKSIKPRLCLTPICPVSTCEAIPLEGDKKNKPTIFKSTVSKQNIFRGFAQSLSGGDNSCDPVFKVDNNKYFKYVVLDKASNIPQPLTDNSYEGQRLIDKNDSNTNNPPKVYVIQKYLKLKQAASLNDIINKAQNCDGLQTIGVNNFNIIWNSNNYNQSKFIELQNTVVTLQGNDYESDHKVTHKSSCVKVISSRVKSKENDSFAIDTLKSSTNHALKANHNQRPKNLELNRCVSNTVITNKSKNDYPKGDCGANRLSSNKFSKPQYSRVSQFDKYIKNEMYPLVSELNDIRNRCISYGLFTSDMVPCLSYYSCKSLSNRRRENKIIDNQTLPKLENEIDKSQVMEYFYKTSLKSQSKPTEYQRKKPNRMVYSILFNDYS